jgi:hypothetical protein
MINGSVINGAAVNASPPPEPPPGPRKGGSPYHILLGALFALGFLQDGSDAGPPVITPGGDLQGNFFFRSRRRR